MAVFELMAALQVIDRGYDDELCTAKANRAVKGAAAAHHNHFALHAGQVGQLIDLDRIAAGETGGGGSGHGARGAGGDHGGFCAGDLCKISSGGCLQVIQS